MKKTLSLILALCLLLSLCACSKTEEPQENAAEAVSETVSEIEASPEEISRYPLSLTDMAGRGVELREKPERIVSGYYISTSALLALGLRESIVGVEAKADSRPIYALAAPELIELPNVGSAKSFDLEGCAALEPELVILPKKLKDQAVALEELGIAVLLVNPENGESLREMITLLSAATDTEARGAELISAMDTLEAELAAALAGTEAPRVYMAGNSSLLTTAGAAMYQSTLVEKAGGENVAAALQDTYWAEVSYEQLLSWNPEVIILPAEAGYDVESVLSDPALSDCPAIQLKQVYQMPNDVEAWDSPVPGSVLGMLDLASVLHPECFRKGYCYEKIRDFYEMFYGFSYEQ